MGMFDRTYIEKELQKINDNLSKQIHLYIFGGGAMSFFNLKTATKDIDILLSIESDAFALMNALYKTGYKNIETKDEIYIQMKTREIIENKDGFRWDIFVDKVCGGLSFSKDMQQRATPFKHLSNLKTYLISVEDIFIFKAVTSRPRDREDMLSLFSHGLDVDIIRKEIQQQTQLDKDKVWLSYFFIGLDELVHDCNVIFPDYEIFLKLAEEEMLERLILEFIRRKPQSLNELVSILKIDKEEIQKILTDFINKKKIVRDQEKFRFME